MSFVSCPCPRPRPRPRPRPTVSAFSTCPSDTDVQTYSATEHIGNDLTKCKYASHSKCNQTCIRYVNCSESGKWKRRIRSDADTDADADTDTDTDTNQNSFFSPLQCRTEAKHGYSLAKSCLLSLLLASFPGSPTREQK